MKYIVIDMRKPYYSVTTKLFPKAKMIIDEFHYVRQVLWGLKNTRKRVQKTLKKEDCLYFKQFRNRILLLTA